MMGYTGESQGNDDNIIPAQFSLPKYNTNHAEDGVKEQSTAWSDGDGIRLVFEGMVELLMNCN